MPVFLCVTGISAYDSYLLLCSLSNNRKWNGVVLQQLILISFHFCSKLQNKRLGLSLLSFDLKVLYDMIFIYKKKTVFLSVSLVQTVLHKRKKVGKKRVNSKYI